MKQSDLESKFHEILVHSPKPVTIYLKADVGYVRLVYRNKWDDGLSNLSLLRIQNTQLGTSTAPTSWENLIALLKLHEISLSEFEIALNRRANDIIKKNQRALDAMKKLFGEEYVTDILTGASSSITDQIISVLRKNKPKPTFSIIKGGSDI